jgi:hypothetical protein
MKIKNAKRVARSYRNFDHYRLRLLLNHGRIHENRSPTRIRTAVPGSMRRAGFCASVKRIILGGCPVVSSL